MVRKTGIYLPSKPEEITVLRAAGTTLTDQQRKGAEQLREMIYRHAREVDTHFTRLVIDPQTPSFGVTSVAGRLSFRANPDTMLGCLQDGINIAA